MDSTRIQGAVPAAGWASEPLPGPDKVEEPCPESDLLHRAASGDRHAVDDLVERYQDSLYSIALTFTRDPYQAEDLTQDAWIRVLRALPGFRGQCRFSTWIYRITMNAFLNRRPSRPAADVEEVGREDPELARLESSMSIIQAVRSLAPEFRAVVALRFIADLSYAEIATALEIPLGTVQSRLKRGLDRLELERGAL